MPITFGTSLVIAPRYRQVLANGNPIDLTRKEFDLLYFLPDAPAKYLAGIAFMTACGAIILNWVATRQ